MRSHGESNPDLIFRRDLFYPLNYETLRKSPPPFSATKLRKVECKTKQTRLFFLPDKGKPLELLKNSGMDNPKNV